MEGQTGMLAAAMSWPDLLRQLSGLAGEFVEQEAVKAGEYGENRQVTPVVAGEVAGKTYLSDSLCRLSGGDDPDLIAEIAVASGQLVVGCGSDPIRGRYY